MYSFNLRRAHASVSEIVYMCLCIRVDLYFSSGKEKLCVKDCLFIVLIDNKRVRDVLKEVYFIIFIISELDFYAYVCLLCL